jgi:hypothetical protein
VEYVFARAADAEPRVEVRRGVSVAGPVAAPLDGRPHVTGVRTHGGEELRADLVVEATGRGSKLPQWLAAAGSEPVPEEVEDGGSITTRASSAATRCRRCGRPSCRRSPRSRC